MRKTFPLIRTLGLAGFAGLLAVSPLLTHNAHAQRAFERDQYHTPPWVFEEHSRHDRDVPPVSSLPQTAYALPSAATWYYCESTKSYYPYVPECKEGWLSVPAIPPEAE